MTLTIVLADIDADLADAWRRTFKGIGGVEIHHGSIFDVEADALVSPANSYGFMDGGIDAAFYDRFGAQIELGVRRQIFDRHHGELLVGQAALVETGDTRHPYLIAAPTMRVPMVLEPNTVNPFLATRAVLLLLRHGQFDTGAKAGERLADHLRRVAFPGMGTGVGKVDPDLCARQMRAAYGEFAAGSFRMPTSWAEASERHQLLYTDRPTRLQ